MIPCTDLKASGRLSRSERPHHGSGAFASESRPPIATRYVPLPRTLSTYSAARLRTDIVAAMTAAALALPSVMAFAELAGGTGERRPVRPLDASGQVALREVVGGLLERNISLSVARATVELRLQLDRVGLTEAIGPGNFHGRVAAAVDACDPPTGTSP